MKHGVGKVLDAKIKTSNLCYTTEIGDELHYVLQCQSLRKKIEETILRHIWPV